MVRQEKEAQAAEEAAAERKRAKSLEKKAERKSRSKGDRHQQLTDLRSWIDLQIKTEKQASIESQSPARIAHSKSPRKASKSGNNALESTNTQSNFTKPGEFNTQQNRTSDSINMN